MEFKKGDIVISYMGHTNVWKERYNICLALEEAGKGKPFARGKILIHRNGWRDKSNFGDQDILLSTLPFDFEHPDKENLLKMLLIGGSEAEFAYDIIQQTNTL